MRKMLISLDTHFLDVFDVIYKMINISGIVDTSSTGWSPGFGTGKRMQEQNDIEQIGCGLKIERLQRLIRFVIVSRN